MNEPVVKMLCHNGPLKAIAFDVEGRHMVTTGLDSRMKVWDIRAFKVLHDYFTTSPGVSLDIRYAWSGSLVAVVVGDEVLAWCTG